METLILVSATDPADPESTEKKNTMGQRLNLTIDKKQKERRVPRLGKKLESVG